MSPSGEHRTERIFAERVSADTETFTPEFEVHSAWAQPGERWLYCYPDDAFAEY